jgi:hypothetical protein
MEDCSKNEIDVLSRKTATIVYSGDLKEVPRERRR